MSSEIELKALQRKWAESVGHQPDHRGYLGDYESNLLTPLSPGTLKAFVGADGSELKDSPKRPAKMRALHSSSALAVNVFEWWTQRDTSALASALGIASGITKIGFESKFKTGLEGKSPNLDLALHTETGLTIGVESKFSEWLKPKGSNKKPFKDKYFPTGASVWAKQNLPACQALAQEIQEGTTRFRHLDAPQLLKHALGMATQLERSFALLYLYYDWPGSESELHNAEIERFNEAVGDELRFRSMTYQALFVRLRDTPGVDRTYLEYLSARYFPELR